MSQLDQLEADVRFVRQAVERDGRLRSPATIYVLWALVVLVGFALVDVRHAWVPTYWAIVGPAGFLASAYLGWRAAIREDRVTIREGRKHLLHWGATLVVTSLATLVPAVGLVPWHGLNALILLVLAVSYFLAGVHLDPPLVWVGVLLAAGYVVVSLGTAYGWTVVGVAVAAALLLTGLRGAPRRDIAP